MKSPVLFFALILSLNISLLLAGNVSGFPTDKNNSNTLKTPMITLLPITPKEADFEEIDLSCTIPVPASFFRKVIPVLPRYADFDDDILPVHVGKLVPVLDRKSVA